jgi:hypothetical protein
MKLKIEKHSLTRGNNFAHELRTFGGKKLAADLEHPGDAAQSLDQPERAVSIGDIKCDYKPVFDARRDWFGSGCG